MQEQCFSRQLRVASAMVNKFVTFLEIREFVTVSTAFCLKPHENGSQRHNLYRCWELLFNLHRGLPKGLLYLRIVLKSDCILQYRAVSFGNWKDHSYTLNMEEISSSHTANDTDLFPRRAENILRRQRKLKFHNSFLYPSFPPRALCASRITTSLTWRSYL